MPRHFERCGPRGEVMTAGGERGRIKRRRCQHAIHTNDEDRRANTNVSVNRLPFLTVVALMGHRSAWKQSSFFLIAILTRLTHERTADFICLEPCRDGRQSLCKTVHRRTQSHIWTKNKAWSHRLFVHSETFTDRTASTDWQHT
jgi:hypothetical protein